MVLSESRSLQEAIRNFESYFINGRYIKSTLIAKALEDGYRGFMMQHKYPFTVLTISLDGTLVDVNVHPNKMELRFSNGEILYQQLAALLSTRLRESELIPKVTVHEEKKQERRPRSNPRKHRSLLNKNVWNGCGQPWQRIVRTSGNTRSGTDRRPELQDRRQ